MNRSFHLWLLIVWMTCYAVYFALARSFVAPSALQITDTLTLSMLGLIVASSWTGLLVVASRVIRGRGEAIAPGLWMLFSLGLVVTAEMVVGALPESFPLAANALTLAARCVAYALPPLSRRMASRWKGVFFLMLLADASLSFPSTGTVLSSGGALIVPLPLMAAAMLRDQHQQRQHGPLHWLGIACWALRAGIIVSSRL